MVKYIFRRKYFFTCVTVLFVFIVGFTASAKTSSKDLKVVNNKVSGQKFPKKLRMIKSINCSSKRLEVQELKDIEFFVNGQPVQIKGKLYEKSQRYYVPFESVAYMLGSDYSEDINKIVVSYDDNSVTVDKNQLYIVDANETPTQMRGEIYLFEDKTYLSISDIERVFNLSDSWDYKNRQICLFKANKIKRKAEKNLNGTAALIRLEDVAAGETMLDSENLGKMKVLADYLYSENIRFHIAWIPRFKDPEKNIDNDLLEISSMENAHFINMLDYMAFRGGVIGLHGYTHQHGGQKSIVSSELTKDYNNSVQATTRILESAIETARELNIPIAFFETPHYGATQLQQKVIEQYFDYIYEPCVGLWNKNPAVSPRNKTTMYIPAPLSYVNGNNVQEMLERINNRPDGMLASFFYHPSKEFQFIKFYQEDNGKLTYTYSEESHMHKLVDTLNKKGYKTITVDQIK